MADEPTFAERQVARCESLLERLGGLQSANIEGETVTLVDLERRYDYWRGRVAVEQGTRVRARSINLGGG